MSIGPFSGLIGSAAGAPLAQTKGAEVDRAQQESANQQRKIDGNVKAEMAAGIGAAGEDNPADADRDADGRLPWQLAAASLADNAEEEKGDAQERQSRDPSGDCGKGLDLCG